MNIPIQTTGVAVVVLRNQKNQTDVLLLKRQSTILNEAWTYIGGKIEQGEMAYEAAIREMKEETGLTPLSMYTSNTFDQFYDPKKNSIYMAPVFVAFVSSKNGVRLNEEHSQFKWCSFRNAKSVVTLPGSEEVLTFIENHFVHQTPLELLKIDYVEVPSCSL
ncbi:NUDIX pyrophosphatase [Shouchella sp. JSM 1781072]|uniref:NUDIX hydrolase n=1 Tax=Bacillaceae TaxID=186817 RepID=UPI000C088F17|nr:NUDIX domain-containing protein [Bacillus sp. Marseille-P3800]